MHLLSAFSWAVAGIVRCGAVHGCGGCTGPYLSADIRRGEGIFIWLRRLYGFGSKTCAAAAGSFRPCTTLPPARYRFAFPAFPFRKTSLDSAPPDCALLAPLRAACGYAGDSLLVSTACASAASLRVLPLLHLLLARGSGCFVFGLLWSCVWMSAFHLWLVVSVCLEVARNPGLRRMRNGSTRSA